MEAEFSKSLVFTTVLFAFFSFFSNTLSFSSLPAAAFTFVWKRGRVVTSSRSGTRLVQWAPALCPCVWWSIITSAGARCVSLWWAKTSLVGTDPTVKLYPQPYLTSLEEDLSSKERWHKQGLTSGLVLFFTCLLFQQFSSDLSVTVWWTLEGCWFILLLWTVLQRQEF